MQSGILKKPEQSKINMHATHAITTSNVKKPKPTSNNIRGCVRSEVLVEITIFWHVIPCNLTDRYRLRHLLSRNSWHKILTVNKQALGSPEICCKPNKLHCMRPQQTAVDVQS